MEEVQYNQEDYDFVNNEIKEEIRLLNDEAKKYEDIFLFTGDTERPFVFVPDTFGYRYISDIIYKIGQYLREQKKRCNEANRMYRIARHYYTVAMDEDDRLKGLVREQKQRVERNLLIIEINERRLAKLTADGKTEEAEKLKSTLVNNHKRYEGSCRNLTKREGFHSQHLNTVESREQEMNERKAKYAELQALCDHLSKAHHFLTEYSASVRNKEQSRTRRVFNRRMNAQFIPETLREDTCLPDDVVVFRIQPSFGLKYNEEYKKKVENAKAEVCFAKESGNRNQIKTAIKELYDITHYEDGTAIEQPYESEEDYSYTLAINELWKVYRTHQISLKYDEDSPYAFGRRITEIRVCDNVIHVVVPTAQFKGTDLLGYCRSICLGELGCNWDLVKFANKKFDKGKYHNYLPAGYQVWTREDGRFRYNMTEDLCMDSMEYRDRNHITMDGMFNDTEYMASMFFKKKKLHEKKKEQ